MFTSIKQSFIPHREGQFFFEEQMKFLLRLIRPFLKKIKKDELHNAKPEAIRVELEIFRESLKEALTKISGPAPIETGLDWDKIEEQFNAIEYSEERWQEVLEQVEFFNKCDAEKEDLRRIIKEGDEWKMIYCIEKLVELEDADTLDLRDYHEELFERFKEERKRLGIDDYTNSMEEIN